ncbi:tetratricopeptide repeat protein [bacterium]|nr:tetratricopeptide repeat protein [bacterium]
MDPRRWQRITELFEQLIALSPHARGDLLATLDEELRDELIAMLAAHDAPGGPLSGPAPLAEDLVRDDLLGAQLDVYRLEERLGDGGMGVVYLGEFAREDVRRRVAIKVIKRGMDSEHIVARFRAEQRILASLDHEGIARMLDVGMTDDGRPYLVMEHVDGRPIDAYAEEQELDLEQRLVLFQQVCRAVHHAHRNLVVHRDLKPSNILVTDRGRAKLLDFGIAKILDPDPVRGDSPVTHTGLRPMTPDYASPEQLRGEAVTTATDVHGLGVLLFLLLTGRHPRRAAEQAGDDAPPRASDCAGAWARRIRGDLDVIVQTAMHPDPERRYGSALALSADVDNHLEGRPVTARRDSFLYTLGKFVGRNRAAVTVAAVAVVAILGFAVGMAGLAHRNARQAEQIRVERDRAEQMQGLVMEMFDVSNPYGDAPVRGDTLRVRDFLRLNQETLLGRLDDQPEVQARFAHLLAQLHGNLGRFDDAVPLIERALALRRELHPGDHPDVALSLDYLGTVRQQLGDFDRAEQRFREALAMRRRLHGEQHLDVAESLNNLSYALVELDRSLEGLEYDRQALAVRRAILGDRHPETVQSLNNLGASLMLVDRQSEAVPVLQEALALRRDLLGDEHPYVANTMNNLARAYLDLGQHGDAEPLLRGAIERWRRTLGPEHPRLAGGYFNLGLTLEKLGRPEEAVAALRRGHAIDTATLPDDHPYLADATIELGRILLELDRPDDAGPLLAQAHRIYRQRHGDDAEDTRRASALLARWRQGEGSP